MSSLFCTRQTQLRHSTVNDIFVISVAAEDDFVTRHLQTYIMRVSVWKLLDLLSLLRKLAREVMSAVGDKKHKDKISDDQQ